MSKLNILVLHGYYSKIAATVHDHLNAFRQYSNNNVVLFPLVMGMPVIPFDIEYFDVIVVHYSLCIFLESHVSLSIIEKLKNFKGTKVIFIQDEYRCIDQVIDRINYVNFDYLYTCVPTDEIEKVYSSEALPLVKKINTLTGFVPENILKESYQDYDSRTVDVVYRARKVPAWLGRLGLEKWQIAEFFEPFAKEYKLKHDIKFNEGDRIYGKNWTKFLKNAKAALGVESGASVFDFTGEIQKNVEEHVKNHPETSFDELEEKYFPGLEGKIILNQISPRCFECAALRTMMVLYEGDYSGILIPWRHYVPLKKDFSNIAEVVAAIKSKECWLEMTNNAYNEIALNPRYSFKYFIESFDKVLSEKKYIAKEFEKPFIFKKLEAKFKFTALRLSVHILFWTKWIAIKLYLLIKKILPKTFQPYFKNFVKCTVAFIR